MHDDTVPIGEETGAKKTFVWARRLARLVPRREDDAGRDRGADRARSRGTPLVAREAGLELPDAHPTTS